MYDGSAPGAFTSSATVADRPSSTSFRFRLRIHLRLPPLLNQDCCIGRVAIRKAFLIHLYGKTQTPEFEEETEMMTKSNTVATVAFGVNATVRMPGETFVPLSAEFHCAGGDPHPVRLSLSAPDVDSVSWVSPALCWSRAPAGQLGAILVNPPHRYHRHSVPIGVRPGADAARIDVPVIEVLEFL